MATMHSSPSVLSARRVRSHSGGASARASSARLKSKSGDESAGPGQSRLRADGGPTPPSRSALLRRHNEQLQDAVECNRLMLTVIEQFKQEKQALERQLKQLRERLAQYDLKLLPSANSDDRGKSPFGSEGSSAGSDISRRDAKCVDAGTQTDPPLVPRRPTSANVASATVDSEGPKPPSPSSAVNLAKKRIALRRLENSTPERARKVSSERSGPSAAIANPPPEDQRQELQHWMQQASGLKELTVVLQGQCETATSQWLALQETTRKIARDVQGAILGLKEELTCPICLDVFSPDTVTLQSCGHSLCRSCLVSLKSVECPSCRTPFYSSCPSATHKSSCVIHTCVKSLKDLESALQPLLGDGFEEKPA